MRPTTPAGRKAIGRWSSGRPTRKKIATFQQDQRQVGEMYLVDTRVGHPVLHAWKYPLPGDKVVAMIERVVIHLDGPRTVRLKMPADQHRSTFTDDIKSSSGGMEDVQWSPDGARLVFVSTSRDHKHEVVRLADPEPERFATFSKRKRRLTSSPERSGQLAVSRFLERNHLVFGARQLGQFLSL